MNISINILEVASELANIQVHEKFNNDNSKIYENETDDVTVYTEEAQDAFNEWYDYYYGFLESFNE